MQADKLFVEAIQGMQDLTNLIEKAISVEAKLNNDYTSLHLEDLSDERIEILNLFGTKLQDTFDKLQEVMNE